MLVWTQRKTSFIDKTNNTYGMKQILSRNKFHWFSQKLPGKCQGRESHVNNWGWKLGHSRKLWTNLRTGYYICFTCSLFLRHKWMFLNMSFFLQASVPWPSYRIFVAILDEGWRGEGYESEIVTENFIYFVDLHACLKSSGIVVIEFCLAQVFILAWKITFVKITSSLGWSWVKAFIWE